MNKFAIGFLGGLTALTLTATGAVGQLLLNEIRVDHGGGDVDEYFEISGSAGTALTGHTLVVIGDGTGGCGIVEAAIDLSPYSIQADGFLAVRYSGGTAMLTGYDVTLTGSFENSDNITFLLVTGWTGSVPSDLDTDNNGTLDSTPWTGIVDEVGLYEGVLPINCTSDEYLYTSVVVGPDGAFSPGHITRCPSATGWTIGPFIAVWPTGALDTPGAANTNCTVAVDSRPWGSVKTLYR